MDGRVFAGCLGLLFALLASSSVMVTEVAAMTINDDTSNGNVPTYCRMRCWDQYIICLSGDGGLPTHLLCVETRINCISSC